MFLDLDIGAQRRPESGSGDNRRDQRATACGSAPLNEGRSLAPATTSCSRLYRFAFSIAQRRPESGSGDNRHVVRVLGNQVLRSTKAGVWLRRQLDLVIDRALILVRSTKAGVWLRRQLAVPVVLGLKQIRRSTKAGVWLRRQLDVLRTAAMIDCSLNEGRSLAPATTRTPRAFSEADDRLAQRRPESGSGDNT